MTQTMTDIPAQPAAKPRAARWAMAIVHPLASLKLTVTLLALSVFLVFAGTLAQVDKGIGRVMDEYFRTTSGIAWIELHIFFTNGLIEKLGIPDIKFPYPGGWLLGGLLLINLICAHATRFSIKAEGRQRTVGWVITLLGSLFIGLLIGEVHFAIQALHDFYVELTLITIATLFTGVGLWYLFEKRAGIVILHAALIILLISEAVTGLYAVEGRMTIEVGGSSNYLEDIRYAELAVIAPDVPGEPDKDLVTVVPLSMLKHPGTVKHASLPFDLEIKSYMVNSGVVRESSLKEPQQGRPLLIFDEETQQLVPHRVVERAEVSGVDPEQPVDLPAIDVVIRDKQSGESLYEGRVSAWHSIVFDQSPRVKIGDKEYSLALRFRRMYKPFTLKLNEFRHDVYPGTDKPKDFSSFVTLEDPAAKTSRDVRIWMNNPLRYSGYTFFQSSFQKDRTGRAYATVLQVVENPGRVIPYLSCIMVAVGLLAHFSIGLSKTLERRIAK